MSRRLYPPPSEFRAPPDFYPAGRITEAFIADGPPQFISNKPPTRGKKRLGIKYEALVHPRMAALGLPYWQGPWLRFFDAGLGRWRWAQPDGLLFDLPRGVCTIVEVKLKHTPGAWFQTRQLYQPVLAHITQGLFDFSILEVVSWIDPHAAFPERYHFVDDPLAVPVGGFGVHILNSRGLA